MSKPGAAAAAICLCQLGPRPRTLPSAPAGWGPDSAPEDCGRLQQLLLEAASCGLGSTPESILSLLSCTFAAQQRPGLVHPAAKAAHRILSCALLRMLGFGSQDLFEGGRLPGLTYRL